LRLRVASSPSGLDGAARSGVKCVSRMRAAAKRTTDYLLVDISNSYTKLAFATTRKLAKPMRFPTNVLTAAMIRRILRKRNAGTIVISSVVPQKNKMMAKAAGFARTLFLNPKLDLGVGVDYPSPRTIGADRLANAAAVAQLYGYPAIVVDFGTAVTFDVVSAKGDYIGGVIAPGLEAMTSFLYQRTALLPKLNLREPKRAIGQTTREAMMSGAIFGYRGLVREILLRVTAEKFPRSKPRVVATGGYAQLIARKLSEIEAVHPNLTLEGLRIVANRNVKKAERS
jgi:type III pantothenate kinase